MARVARKMVYDRDVVSDIVQEVFIYLHEKLSEGKKIIHLRSWLYRATFNKCVDHLRKRHRFVDVSEAHGIECESKSLETEDIKNAISLALEKLSPIEKILIVSYSEGLSYKEMSQLTDIPFTSIGKTLSRTVKKLSTEMKKKDYGLY